MLFCVKKILNGDPTRLGGELEAAVLEDMTVWVWLADDDYAFKHAAYFPDRGPEGSKDGDERITLVCRWIDAIREYDLAYPHCNRCGRGRWTIEPSEGALAV